MKYQLLQALLPYLETYERSQGPTAEPLQHFAVWLARQTGQVPEEPGVAGAQENHIARLLSFQHRYARSYARKLLDGSPISTYEEYTYLEELASHPGLSKIELIQRNRHEKPTGMEIIRRLMGDGLIVQQADPDDKRSKQLFISATGLQALQDTGSAMQKVQLLMSGKLNPVEKMLLRQLLEKLETFHQVVQAKTRE